MESDKITSKDIEQIQKGLLILSVISTVLMLGGLLPIYYGQIMLGLLLTSLIYHYFAFNNKGVNKK